MKSIILFALLIASAYCQCSFNFRGLGTKYFSAQGAPGVFASGDTFGMNYGYRAYITDQCIGSGMAYNPNGFTTLNLLDKTLSVTIDLSPIGCGCNAALYMSQMPGRNPDGTPNPSHDKDYYCDSNDVGGAWCPEMDLMEANNRAMQVTPHKCYSMNGQQYTNCDRGGCGMRIHTGTNFGWGANFKINTQNQFNVSWTFRTSGGSLNSIETLLQQGSNSVSITHNDGSCGGGYLASMTSAMKQMVLIVAYWSGASGSDMSCLDVPPCDINTACARGGNVKFSYLQLSG